MRRNWSAKTSPTGPSQSMKWCKGGSTARITAKTSWIRDSLKWESPMRRESYRGAVCTGSSCWRLRAGWSALRRNLRKPTRAEMRETRFTSDVPVRCELSQRPVHRGLADALQYPGTTQLLKHIGTYFAQHDPSAHALKVRGDLIQCRQSRGIHERHACHSNHHGAHAVLTAPKRLFQIFGRAKEERTIDAVYDGILR